MFDKKNKTSDTKENSTDKEFAALKEKDKNNQQDKMSIEELINNIKDTLFIELTEEMNDDSITDIEWDGDCLWLKQIGIGCYLSPKKLSKNYVDNLAIRLSNIMGRNFNQANPVLEADTKTLRISITHESRSGKKSITIRKLPVIMRYGHEDLVNAGTIPEKLLNLLENCVIAHCTVLIGGTPQAGKTELLKYLTNFIPANEKVMTIEDNSEIHYKELHPNKNCTPFIVDKRFGYSEAIKMSLRHNTDWVLISESRGKEVKELINVLNTGLHCMTTLHLDEVSDIPDRLFSMLEDQKNSRFIDNVYKYIDVGLVIAVDKKQERKIIDFGFFERNETGNHYRPFYNIDDGVIPGKDMLPENMKKIFKRAGIDNPYERPKAYTGAIPVEKERSAE